MEKKSKSPKESIIRKVRFTLPEAQTIDNDENESKAGKEKSNKKNGSDQNASTQRKHFITKRKDELKVHGTARYINGTLNFSTNDYKAVTLTADSENATKKQKIEKKIAIVPRNQFTNDGTTIIQIRKASADQMYWNKALNEHGILHITANSNQPKRPKRRKKFDKTKIRSYTTILMAPSKYLKRSPLLRCRKGKRRAPVRTPNILQLPAKTKPFEKLNYKLSADKPNISKRIANCFHIKFGNSTNKISVQELNERIALLNVHSTANTETDQYEIKAADENLSEILQMAHRWHERLQQDSPSFAFATENSNKRIDDEDDKPSTRVHNKSVEFCTFKKSDVQNISQRSMVNITGRGNLETSRVDIMNKQKIPLVTTLLRASRNQDEDVIRYVLESILSNGISEDDLNAVDCSGRTALSYMCSTNVTQFLEILLQAPGIDINKPDIELNTPLHYASECGQLGAIRLLLLENKLQIDAKNVFGFTPLMKAAMQGHTRCAKTLLFAGASPVEIDYKRQLRAEQWARFCGRHSCAEVIEKCSRARLLDKETTVKWSHDPFLVNKEMDNLNQPMVKGRARANSAVQTTTAKITINPNKNSNDGGIRSKISKVFNFVSRDKSNNQSNNNKNSNFTSNSTNNKVEIASYTGPMYQKGQSMLSRSDGFLNKSLMRPLEVPKLEITSPHNQELIRKYEKRYSLGNNESTKPPALPPRRSSKAII